MPGNSHPPRHRSDDDAPNLGTKALMRSLEKLAAQWELVGARFAYKMNAAGEHVIALIFDSFPCR